MHRDSQNWQGYFELYQAIETSVVDPYGGVQVACRVCYRTGTGEDGTDPDYIGYYRVKHSRSEADCAGTINTVIVR